MSGAVALGEVGEPVPDALASAQVIDRGGESSPLSSLWEGAPAVVVFLRHFACMTCSEHVALLAPRLQEMTRLGLKVVYVGNGASHYMDGFIQRNALDLDAVELVTDPTLEVHRALQLERSWWSAFGPSAVAGQARAFLRGFRQKSVDGDNYQQGGVLVVDRDGKIAFLHRDRYSGDHADSADVIDAAMRVAAAGATVV